ncbi:MAG: prenyltransferase/squalene oxidase repeat-containing protein [Armatimonadota bacterium]
MNHDRLTKATSQAVEYLLGEMQPEGYWKGELSSSALSTAIAVSAMAVSELEAHANRITAGVEWLTQTQNSDGGWGDTSDSPSNLSTTLLVIAALRLSKQDIPAASTRANAYIEAHTGSTANEIVKAVTSIYGEDRTFAVPILMNCALAGMVPWSSVPSLPFELAVFPQSLFRFLRLHVVSYALPALIAIGITLYHRNPPKSAMSRYIRRAVMPAALAILAKIQPVNGGFLEATPLTGFVAMSLGSVRGAQHPVVNKCLEFICASQRDDGSWPIDTDLSVWLTTGAVSAIDRADSLHRIETSRTAQWICHQQQQLKHPFTSASPGGFPWTHHPGGVPDADDTSGAVLALLGLNQFDSAAKGVSWLRGLQNADGGWPAFCRGWGQLPFDKSSPDITSHALRALHAFGQHSADRPLKAAIENGFAYLHRTQNEDGAWIPLWFGNQATETGHNPVYGTARTLLAYAVVRPSAVEAVKGVKYLVSAQNSDGGWGGAPETSSSIEESATVLSALCQFSSLTGVSEVIKSGSEYLVSRVEDGSWTEASPIGLYFSSLWYSERLYPVIWTVEALGSINALQNPTSRIGDDVSSA